MSPKKPMDDKTLDQLLSGRIENVSERFERKAAALLEDENVAEENWMFRNWIPVFSGIAAVLAILFFVVVPQDRSGDGSNNVEIALTTGPMYEELFEMDAALAPAEATLNPEFFEALRELSSRPF